MALTKIPGNLIEAGAITAASLDNDAVTTTKILDANITHAKLHTSMDLTGKTVTVATAAGGTNTTAAASTAFVQQELTTLIDGAPGTLDTLNELAAAINDDANYNSTLTTALATKAPLASPIFTGNVDVAGNITVGNQNSILAENNLRFKSAGAAYIDHNTVGQDINFRISNSSSLDTTIMTLDAGVGSVGINQSQPSSTYKLDVGGSIRSAGSAPSLVLRETDTSPNQDWLLGSYSGTFAIRDVTGGTYPVYIEQATPSSTLYLDSSGNVGIGNNNPGAPLDITGSSTLQTAVARITRTIAAASNNTYTFEVDSSSHTSNMTSGGAMKVDVNSGRAFTINGFGNVGIRTDSPAKNLEIFGSGSESGILVKNDTNTNYRGIYFGALESDNTSYGKIHMVPQTGELNITSGYSSWGGLITFDTDGSERMRITSTGEIVTGGLTSSTGQLHLYKADATGGKLILQSQVSADATAKISMMSRLADNTNKTAYIEAYRGNISFGGESGYGKVGINVEKNGNSAPQKTFHVEHAAGASEGILISGASDITGHTAGILLRAEGGEADSDLRAKGAIFFERTATYGLGKLHLANNIGNDNTSATLSDARLTISGSNVGIGTTSPDYQLDIENSSHAMMRLHAGTSSSASLRLQNDAQHFDVNLQTNDKFAIYDHTAGTQPFTIMPTTGNVGIGTADPTAHLEIAAGGPTLILNANTQATNKKKVRIAVSQHTAGDFNIQQMNDNGTTIAQQALLITNAGDIAVGGTGAPNAPTQKANTTITSSNSLTGTWTAPVAGGTYNYRNSIETAGILNRHIGKWGFSGNFSANTWYPFVKRSELTSMYRAASGSEDGFTLYFRIYLYPTTSGLSEYFSNRMSEMIYIQSSGSNSVTWHELRIGAGWGHAPNAGTDFDPDGRFSGFGPVRLRIQHHLGSDANFPAEQTIDINFNTALTGLNPTVAGRQVLIYGYML